MLWIRSIAQLSVNFNAMDAFQIMILLILRAQPLAMSAPGSPTQAEGVAGYSAVVDREAVGCAYEPIVWATSPR